MNNTMQAFPIGYGLPTITIPSRRFVIALALTGIVAALAFLVAPVMSGFQLDSHDELATAAEIAVRPDLPKEWQWSPRTVEYEHMYRAGGAADRKLDWIRNSDASTSSRSWR